MYCIWEYLNALVVPNSQLNLTTHHINLRVVNVMSYLGNCQTCLETHQIDFRCAFKQSQSIRESKPSHYIYHYEYMSCMKYLVSWCAKLNVKGTRGES